VVISDVGTPINFHSRSDLIIEREDNMLGCPYCKYCIVNTVKRLLEYTSWMDGGDNIWK